MALLEARGLVKRFGGLTATDRLDLDVVPGEIHAVIGPNGAGKTTLVGQLAGEIAPDAGRIFFAGRDITALPASARSHLGLARSFQITSVFADFTALANVALAVQAHAGHSFRFLGDTRRDERLRGPARALLAEVGLSGREEVPAGTLAHGEKRALEIAMALASTPRLLLLDEPTAGMGPEESTKLADLLHRLRHRAAILLIEHDMDVVFRLADRITVLVYGAALAVGTPDAIRDDVRVREAYLGEEVL